MKLLAFLLIFSFSSSALARPSCKELNSSWAKQHQQGVEFVSFGKKSFSCPSETANVATAFYYLDTIDIIDNSGNEIFDYYSYVFNKLTHVIKADSDAASSASSSIIIIGSSLYATHSPSGKPYDPIGIEGAETLVHERKHMDAGNLKHVKCKPSDQYKDCDPKFHDLVAGEADIFDTHVGAYSVSVSYITDTILHGRGNDLSVARSKYVIKDLLSNRFKSSGITNTQYTNVLNRINAL